LLEVFCETKENRSDEYIKANFNESLLPEYLKSQMHKDKDNKEFQIFRGKPNCSLNFKENWRKRHNNNSKKLKTFKRRIVFI
jgi:hypothetical protein